MCRQPQSEVPPGAVWEEPKTEQRMLAAKRRATRGVSVLVAQFALGGRKTQQHPPPSYLPGDRLRFLGGACGPCSAAAPSGCAAPSASPPLSPDGDVETFGSSLGPVPEEAVVEAVGLVGGRGRGVAELR